MKTTNHWCWQSLIIFIFQLRQLSEIAKVDVKSLKLELVTTGNIWNWQGRFLVPIFFIIRKYRILFLQPKLKPR